MGWHDKGSNQVKARIYFAKSKQIAALRSVCSHINNLFDGVEKKFRYKMRLGYAHFPINANITNGGKTVEVRNYLGEKNVRIVNLLEGVTIEKAAAVKDELVLVGADIDQVSRSAALIRQSCLCKDKDIRKFLDGVYVKSHGLKEE